MHPYSYPHNFSWNLSTRTPSGFSYFEFKVPQVSKEKFYFVKQQCTLLSIETTTLPMYGYIGLNRVA